MSPADHPGLRLTISTAAVNPTTAAIPPASLPSISGNCLSSPLAWRVISPMVFLPPLTARRGNDYFRPPAAISLNRLRTSSEAASSGCAASQRERFISAYPQSSLDSVSTSPQVS